MFVSIFIFICLIIFFLFSLFLFPGISLSISMFFCSFAKKYEDSKKLAYMKEQVLKYDYWIRTFGKSKDICEKLYSEGDEATVRSINGVYNFSFDMYKHENSMLSDFMKLHYTIQAFIAGGISYLIINKGALGNDVSKDIFWFSFTLSILGLVHCAIWLFGLNKHKNDIAEHIENILLLEHITCGNVLSVKLLNSKFFYDKITTFLIPIIFGILWIIFVIILFEATSLCEILISLLLILLFGFSLIYFAFMLVFMFFVDNSIKIDKMILANFKNIVDVNNFKLSKAKIFSLFVLLLIAIYSFISGLYGLVQYFYNQGDIL